MKDYGCKSTAPGPDHVHSCDMPAGNQHHLVADVHFCTSCENWWRPAAEPGVLATIANDTEQTEQGSLW